MGVVFGCADTPQEIELDPSDITPLPILNQPVVTGVPEWLEIPTYDSSGQGVHPDIAYFPRGWQGWEYWMAFTPYPNGNSAYENPSILVSHDGRQWSVPEGLTEPVVAYGTDSASYNSDPDLFAVPASNELVMVYRQVRGGYNILRRLVSVDGATWTDPVEILRAPNHQLISPSIVLRPGRSPVMWVVDAGSGCSSLTTQVVARRWHGQPDMITVPGGPTWSKPIVTNLQQPGYIIWHLDVTWVESLHEYWAVYPARPAISKTCTTGNNLFVARSRDGVHWQTFEKPVVTTGVTPWATRTIYRSSMLYNDHTKELRIWMSAASTEGTWYLGYIEVPVVGSTPAGNVASLSRIAIGSGVRSLKQPPPAKPGRVVKDSFP